MKTKDQVLFCVLAFILLVTLLPGNLLAQENSSKISTDDHREVKPTGTVTINGMVTNEFGVPVGSARISMSGLSGYVYTNSSGFYTRTFTTLGKGYAGWVSVSRSGLYFETASKFTTVVIGSVYVGFSGRYPVASGYMKEIDGVPIAGARVWTGSVFPYGLPRETLTDANGRWAMTIGFHINDFWVSKDGYSFNPVSWSIDGLNEDRDGYDSVGTAINYEQITISGYARRPNGAAVPGVRIKVNSYMNSETTTNSSGYYEVSIKKGWAGTSTVTPVKSGLYFSPSLKTYKNVTSNQKNENYVATNSSAGDKDLAVTQGSLYLSSTDIAPGQRLLVQPPEIRYSGSSEGTANFFSSIVISEDDVIDPSDTLVKKLKSLTLSTGDSYRMAPVVVKIPKTVEKNRTYYIGYIVDSTRKINELSEANNTSLPIPVSVKDIAPKQKVSFVIRDSSSEINSNGVGAEKNSYDVRLGKKTLGSGSDISKSKKVFLGQIYELKIKPESGSAQPADSNQFSEATVIITPSPIFINAYTENRKTKLLFNQEAKEQVLKFMVPAGSIDNVKFGIQDNSTFLYPHCNETVELTGTVTSEGSPDLLNMKAYLVGVDSNGKGFRNLADLDEKGKYKFANVPKGSKFKVYLTNFDKSKYWASPSFAKGKANKSRKVKTIKLNYVREGDVPVYGRVVDYEGNGIWGVVVKGGSNVDISNESGKFACYVAPGSSTVINLEKEGWSFEVVDGSNGREFIGISEPAITGVFPNTIKKKSGKDVVQSVRITGVNLMENCKILTSNPGIVCEDIIFISSTEVAANFRIKSSCPELNIYLAFRNPDMQSEGFWIRVK